MEKTLFDTNLNDQNKVSKELLKFLISNKNSTRIYETNNVIMFENTETENQYNYKIIVLIKNYNKITIGSLIYLSKNKITNSDISYISLIRHNIEFYSDKNTNINYSKFINNPINNSSYISDISNIINTNIKQLF